jgi:hypothetical protein
VAVFRFGAVIFFGSAEQGQREWLERLRKYVTLDEDERSGRKAGDAQVEMTDGELRGAPWRRGTAGVGQRVGQDREGAPLGPGLMDYCTWYAGAM